MALLTSTVQELLPFFPDALHGKLADVYHKVPGSFIKFLDPMRITKKIECREQDLRVDPSMLTDQRDDGMHATHAPQSPIHYNGQRPTGSQSKSYGDPQKPNYEKTSSSTPPSGYAPAFEYNKYRNPLRTLVFHSISKVFVGHKITDVPAKALAEDIVQHCFQQVPDWGRHRCQTPSTIVRFNSHFINEQPNQSVNINVYVYAFLKFEYNESRLPFKGDKLPKISFEITIELNGVAVNLKRLTEMDQLLTSNNVPDAIQMIESISAVYWEDLEHQGSKPAPPPKTKLTWNDL